MRRVTGFYSDLAKHLAVDHNQPIDMTEPPPLAFLTTSHARSHKGITDHVHAHPTNVAKMERDSQ